MSPGQAPGGSEHRTDTLTSRVEAEATRMGMLIEDLVTQDHLGHRERQMLPRQTQQMR